MEVIILVINIYLIATERLCDAHGSALTFELPDSEKFCFVERFKGGERYVFEYSVLRGGNNDVDASITSPNGLVTYNKEKTNKDRFVFDASLGDFRFCFSNQFSTFTHKVVYFNLRPEDIDNLAVEAGDNQPTAKTAFESFCDQIHEAMTSTVNFQKDYRLKESVGRHIAENMQQGVLVWSIGQAVIILLAGLGQVFILKTFFTERRVKNENTGI